MKPITSFLLLFITLYQWILSILLPGKCRFQPTCSEYTKEAIQSLGIVKGGWLSMKRLISCHPWGKHGFDPVPKSAIKTSS